MQTRLRRFVSCLLFATAIGVAQDRGTITGSVSDSSGAAIPAAKITLQNPATGLIEAVPSANDGTFRLLSLPAGRYTITAEKEGFRKLEVSDVRVDVNTDTRLDLKMQVGTLQETVEVQGTPPLLQTERADLGQIVDKEAIQGLPLFANGGLRSNLAFTTLAPGVNINLTGDPDTTGANIRIAGGLSNGASLLLDGAESMSERRNDPQMRIVSAEGIEEFKIQSSAYSAEYGRSSNGILNYTTKSGTNVVHGTGFVTIRNQALNANGFFYTPSPPTIHNQNLEAASVGGPAWIPKIFNGKNKMFFFFSGERSRAKDISPAGLISLPTAQEKAGDFSQYTNSAGKMIPIYNPFDAAGGVTGDASTRVPFPGNQIPTSMINPTATLIQSYLPLPQSPNSIFNNNPIDNNGTRTPGENQGVYGLKVDLNATEKLRFSSLFSRQYFNSYPLDGPIPGPLGEGFQEFGTTKYVRFNGDYVVKPTLLSHFSFGYNQRDLGEQGNERLGPTDGDYGKATAIPGNLSYGKSPNYSAYQTQNYQNMNSTVSTRSPGRTYDFKESLTYLKGRHSMKFGFEFMRVNYARSDCNGCGGIASFTSAATGSPSVSGTTGFDYASLLLGAANGGSFNYNGNINYVYPYYAWYYQDDIKLTSKLTINVGLRYDLPLARREPNAQSSNFSMDTPNPAAGNLPGALIFAGSGPGRSGRTTLLQARLHAFGPRFGFAYQLNSKTVIRGGGAIMYDSNREDGNADGGVQGFGGNFSAPANYLSTGISFLLPQGFNTFAAAVQAAKPPVINPSLANFGSPSYFSDGKVGQFYDYNFTVERSLTSHTLLRTSFHANYGNQLQSSQQYDQLDPRYFAIYGTLLGSPLSSVLNNPIVVNSGFHLPYAGYPTNYTLAQALLPFPQYTSINGTTNGGHSTWNALEASLQHSFTNGLFISAAYTFSKLIANSTSANVYFENTEKAISTVDRPHVFTLATIYDVPFGRGKRLGSNLNPVANFFLGNWRASAVQHYQSGVAIGVTSAQTLYGAGSARPNFVPGQPLLNPNWNPKDPNSPYINTTAFVQPANLTYGNVPAVIPGLRNPVQMDEDVALSKIFNLGSEKRTVEFRGSAFNVANRHLLGGLTTSITSSTFGKFTNPQSNLPRNVEFSLRLKF
jgi:hypothetical protein